MNPELYNFVILDNSNNITISYGSDYPSLMSSGRQQQRQSFSDRYTSLILEESEKLYNKLTTELTYRVIAAAATHPYWNIYDTISTGYSEPCIGNSWK
jgi:hypothetical protein